MKYKNSDAGIMIRFIKELNIFFDIQNETELNELNLVNNLTD